MKTRKPRNSNVSPFADESETSMVCSTAIRPSEDCNSCIIRSENKYVDMWPLRSSSCCFHCVEKFETPPRFIPICRSSNSTNYRLFGNFCSWACAFRYILDNPTRIGGNAQMCAVWLCDLARTMGEKKPIIPAPPQLALRKFGGPLSIEQFKTYMGEKIVLLQKPFLPCETGIQLSYIPGKLTDIRRSGLVSDVPSSSDAEKERTGVGYYRNWIATKKTQRRDNEEKSVMPQAKKAKVNSNGILQRMYPNLC